MPHQDPESRSYPLNPLRYIPLNFMFSLFVLGGLAMLIFAGPRDRLAMLVPAAFLILIGAAFLWLFNRTRVHVSPSGVRLRFFWLTLETPWSNIEKLRMDRGYEAFITASPMEGSGPQRMTSMGGRPTYDSAALDWIYERRYIPLAPFSWYLRRGLGEDLRRFAPHLQAALDAGAPPRDPAATRKDTRIILLTLVPIAAFVTLMFSAPELMGKVVNVSLAIVTPLMAILGGWSAIKAFRQKRIVWGILGALFAIILALTALGLIGAMLEPPTTKSKRKPATPLPPAAAVMDREP